MTTRWEPATQEWWETYGPYNHRTKPVGTGGWGPYMEWVNTHAADITPERSYNHRFG